MAHALQRHENYALGTSHGSICLLGVGGETVKERVCESTDYTMKPRVSDLVRRALPAALVDESLQDSKLFEVGCQLVCKDNPP